MSSPTAGPVPGRTTGPVKAVHSWSLFRTLGRLVAPGSMPSGDLPEGGGGALDLLGLPAGLARHGFVSTQLCHFYLASRDPAYLAEVRAAFAEAGVELECLLIDDGDVTHPTSGAAQQDWISGWLDAAVALGAPRARVVAGKQAPTDDTLALAARRLSDLAERHPEVRVVTENWHALLPDARSVERLLDDGEDFRRCLGVLRDAGYAGPLALVHDGPDPDEWGRLDEAYALVTSVFGPSRRP